MDRLRLIKEIFWKPIWGVLVFAWGLVGHTFNILEFFSIDVSDAAETIMKYSIAEFIISNWWWITIIIFSLAIAEGIYIKAHPYFGYKIKTENILLTIKQDIKKYEKSLWDSDEQFIYLLIENKENFDLDDCYVSLEKIELIQPDINLPWIEEVNENLSEFSWPLFSQEKQKYIRRKKRARINIAKMKVTTKDLFLLLEEGDKPLLPISGGESYYIEIGINGKIASKEIEELLVCGNLSIVKDKWILHGAKTTSYGMEDGEKVIESIHESPAKKITSYYLTFKENRNKNDWPKK